MSQKGDWIANCRPEKVGRIAAASIYLLRVGEPQPNQVQTKQDLMAQGLVGLYRVGKKGSKQIVCDQKDYLDQTEFTPTPEVLRSFLGPLG